MSDHISGPRAIADPVTDITDVFAFPCPESPEQLVLVMNVFPYAGPSALFSDAIIYRFRVRSAAIASTGRAASFAVGADEVTFDCVFEGPANPDSGTQPVQWGCCITPNGGTIPFRVNDEMVAEAKACMSSQDSDRIRSSLTGRWAQKPSKRDNLRSRKLGPTDSTAKMSWELFLNWSGRPCSKAGLCSLWSAKP